jgi:hypothetical protein
VPLPCQPSRAKTTFPCLPASLQLTPTRQLTKTRPITHSILTQTPPQPIVQHVITKETYTQTTPQLAISQSTASQTIPVPTKSTSTQTAPSLFAMPALTNTLPCQPPRFGFPAFSFGPTAPPPAPYQRACALSDSQPRSLAPAPPLPLAFPPAPTMTTHLVTGPAAMLCATKTPSFNRMTGEPIADFLIDYSELADGCNLTNQQKVETILRYIPHTQRDLWKSLKGYTMGNWTTF